LGTSWEFDGNTLEEEKKKTKKSQPLRLAPETMNPQLFNSNIETYEDVQISWPSFIVLKRQKKFSTLQIRLGFPCLARLVISMHMRPCHRI
jgi:hypothetical protein